VKQREYEDMRERNWREKEEVIGNKLVSVPLCPHKLDCSRTRASAVKMQQLTAWAMIRTLCY